MQKQHASANNKEILNFLNLIYFLMSIASANPGSGAIITGEMSKTNKPKWLPP
jgi:hypothetical protein